MITIRRIEIDSDEIDAVRALDHATLPECGPADNTEWWGAFDSELPGDYGPELVAYAGARILNSGAWFLSRAGVREAWRGQGLQARLIRVRLKRGRALGCPRAVTYTVPDNAPSMRNLIRCGLQPYTPEVAWAGADVVYWRRYL